MMEPSGNSVQAILGYRREKKTLFWDYLAWNEEKLSVLDDILSVYAEMDEVWERWCPDSFAMERLGATDDEIYEADNLQLEVLDLRTAIDMKFGTYKTVLLWAREHPGEADECLEFYLPDKFVT